MNELEIRKLLKENFQHYASRCLKIRTKSGSIESFTLNKAQMYMHQRIEHQRAMTGKVRAIILKGRQQGCSTYVGGRFYHKVTYNRGTQAFILTHALDATQNLYKMAQRFYENTPTVVRPAVTTSNAKELIFGVLDSGYKLGTAENKSVGRSATVQLLHGSEVAFWANASEHAKGIMQAVPNVANTEIILESTARGIGNYFHEQWQLAEAGISDFIAIFVPWFWQDEYKRNISIESEQLVRTGDYSVLTPEEMDLKRLYALTDQQLYWRRYKIIELSANGQDGAKAFKQEYPCTPVEAFISSGEDTFITNDLVAKARKCQDAEKYGKLIVGVDPARFGDDRTSIIRRQGRVAYNLQSYTKKDTMQVAGLVHQIIIDEQPCKVCIDVGGLGAGVIDRLFELGYRDVVIPINFGSSAFDGKKYSNKRAEMWGLCKQWLIDEPCSIPDSESLHADLCSVKYDYNSNNELVIESKKIMKKRGIRSSDEADALCLTFAIPTKMLETTTNSTAAKIMRAQKNAQIARKFYNEQTRF